MDRALQRLLADLEGDTAADTAEAFARLVVAYYADTRTGGGRVSPAHPPAEPAARFEEPLPLLGLPLADVLARLERDVLPDCNRLTHPRSMGHQVSDRKSVV